MRPFPGTIRETYKGGASLWLSLGPTTVLEDVVTRGVEAALPPEAPQRQLIAAALSGVVAGVTVTAQVENLITLAHSRSLSVPGALKHVHAEEGAFGLLLPRGMLAMAGREVPFASALFYARPAISQAVYGDEGPRKIRWYKELFAGTLTALASTPFSHAPSVVVAYQQGHGISLSQACTEIYRQGGLAEFYRGFTARTVSLAGTMTVVPVVLDLLSAS